MKRQIKFRGKDLIHNQWIYGGLAEDRNNNVVILPKNDWRKGGCVNEDTVGQFSERSDNTGKEIYEADIIRTPLGNIVIVEFGYKEHVVKNQKLNIFEKYACYGWLARNVKNNHVDFLDDSIIKGEVIGNIHDNPELLKKSTFFSPTCETCNSY